MYLCVLACLLARVFVCVCGKLFAYKLWQWFEKTNSDARLSQIKCQLCLGYSCMMKTPIFRLHVCVGK